MGKLIAVVGNSGVGKSTLVRLLSQQRPFVTGLEQHGERPFQQWMAQDQVRWGLTNQIDYLLLRAEQESVIRQSELPGLQDGGLEMDYFVFNRRFHQRGYMNDAEFALCTRFYHFIRSQLPPPDLIIHLVAPISVAAERFAQRARRLEIAKLADLAALDQLLADWLAQVTTPLITIDASADDASYLRVLPRILAEIDQMVSGRW